MRRGESVTYHYHNGAGKPAPVRFSPRGQPMTTFHQRPGELPAAETGDGGFMMLVGTPDTVRLPPEHGGGVVRVVDEVRADCPRTGRPACRLLVLENGMGVLDNGGEFLWGPLRAFGLAPAPENPPARL